MGEVKTETVEIEVTEGTNVIGIVLVYTVKEERESVVEGGDIPVHAELRCAMETPDVQGLVARTAEKCINSVKAQLESKEN